MSNENLNKESSATQCAMIATYLKEGGKLTSLEALRKFGCLRLASRIHDLRERGMNIATRYIIVDSGKRVVEYSLATQSDNDD